MIWSCYSAFAGLGAWDVALKRVASRHGDSYKLLGYWEFDKYASNAFAAVHGVSEDLNHWDITEDKHDLAYADIFFYSPPCQTYSIAGKQEGSSVDKGNLFWNALQKIKVVKPKFCIMENVANLANQFRSDLDNMLLDLEASGYENYAKVMNTKDYGIPQNRARIFIVSIRRDLYDEGWRWELPKTMKLTLKLKDLLEDDVDNRYYLSDKAINGFISHKEKQKAKGNGFGFEPTDGLGIASAVLTRAGGRPDDNFLKVNQIGSLNRSKGFNGNSQQDRIYSDNGLCPTLNTGTGGDLQPKILVNSATVGGARRSKPRGFNQPRASEQQNEKGESG